MFGRNVGCGLLFIVLLLHLGATASIAGTSFQYGGYIKFDANHTYYHNGGVVPGCLLRDCLIPALIPVGGDEGSYNVDYHVKESRFNFTTLTDLANGWELTGYLEMDFLLSPGGDERVSSSFNPRLRHFYFATGPWLAGQTWTTFMIVILPDDLDFIGAPEGVVFCRQAQVRFTTGPWQFSLENPATTLTAVDDGTRIVTETSAIADMVARHNFAGDWGSLGISAMLRQLRYNDPENAIDTSEFGFGVTAGGQFNLSRDDIKLQATVGRGLGRYVGLNLVNAAAVDSTGNLTPIDEFAGFLAYRHFWNKRWRTTVDVSVFIADNPPQLPDNVSENAGSASINLLYSPDPKVTLGVEYTHARREIKSGADGQFDRLQVSARYDFGYKPPD